MPTDPRYPAIKIVCPSSYNAANTTKIQAQFTTVSIECVPCPRGSHMLKRGTYRIDYVNNTNFDIITWASKNPLITQSTPIIGKCIDCPPGGNCTYGIKSQGNYFGQYIVASLSDKRAANGGAERTIKFMPCPPAYCCSNQGRLCTNVTSCNYNRYGNLCGACHDGFYESYFSPQCLDNKQCTASHQRRFWLVFAATAFVLTLLVFATKDFAVLLVALLMYFEKKLKRLKKKITVSSDDSERNMKLKRTRFESRIEYNNNRISNDCIVKKPAPRRFIFSAVLQITLSFFQIVSLLKIQNNAEHEPTINRVINLFNLEVAVKEAEELCPFQSVDVLWKNFIKKILFIVTMLAFVVLFACVFAIVRFFRLLKDKRRSRSNEEEKGDIRTMRSVSTSPKSSKFSPLTNEYFKGLFRFSFLDKLILCFVKILMFGYKNISLFAIVSLNCVKVYGESVLYISGNVRCYQGWQWLVVVILILWVIPFPMALVQAYRLYDTGFVNRFCYVACLMFPLLAFALTIKYRGQKSRLLHEREGLQAALYDNFEEPYRIVQSHEAGDDNVQKTLYWWSAWRLYERLFIAMLVTFLIEPLFRMCVVAPVIVFLSILHYQIKPYKETMPLMSLLDISSYVFLTFFVVDSMFRSFAYTFDLPLQDPLDKGIKTLNAFEAVLTPLTVLCLFAVTLILEALYDVTKTISKKTE